ncbi:MAG TPA: aminomethyl-transferring glycine dehydrogenase subunit GcvPA [Armatimonadota bacterium]|nr:aminomethyl-transferring glycine dehydrogenase subunit GcvPA [Armatimonadota bacterium]
MNVSSKRNKLSYIPTTEQDRAEMLQSIGAPSVDTLFEQIPAEARLDRNLRLPPGLAEQDVVSLLEGMAARNKHLGELTCFLGAGAYDHFIPSVVDAVISRSEFFTAYTPYQPEASQGVLQSIFEYQSMVAALTQMEVSNASLYDAGTALGEAIIMAHTTTKRNTVLVSRAIHPHYMQVLSSYVSGLGIKIGKADYADGVTNLTAMREHLDESVAAVVVQYPNFFGGIEPLEALTEAAHAVGAFMIVCVDPIALGLLTPPGAYDVDIVVGEGQPLGIPVGFGGPFLGLFACKQEHMWKMPGRVVGATTDSEGRTAYTLTLQTREQHIRREKATSNICTNQALMALAATVYLSALGKDGLRHVAELTFQKAHYAQQQICGKAGYSAAWNVPFFKEFVIRSDKPVDQVNQRLLDNGILGGLNLGKYYPELENHMLLCVTERRTKEEIDRLVELL